MEIINEKSSRELVELVSAEKALEMNILPVKKEGNKLTVGVTNPNNLKLLNDLRFDTGFQITAIEMDAEAIHTQLLELFPELNKNGNGQNGDRNGIKADSSNVEFVNQIISAAISAKASDIHFEILENSFRIRYRIDGHLREISSLSPARGLPICSRIKIMANLDISEKRRPQDGRIKFLNNKNEIDIRVSTLPTSFGEKIVLRILDKSQLQLDINKLGFNQSQKDLLIEKINSPFGMILVTGPTGSGKTTSLYTALQLINSIEKNILTIEDPIEYNLEGINQSNVKSDIGYTFANALRSFLRQDPDIIMVGEIRDKETAEIAIRASLTGHLVFSTLHTNDSVSALNRLIDMGVEPFLVASSVKLIAAQRLVRTLCSCKEPETSHAVIEKTGSDNVFKNKGCPRCNQTGYAGRTAIFELFNITPDIAEDIAENKPTSAISAKAKENGFITLRDAGIEKIKNGITTYEEVLRETMH